MKVQINFWNGKESLEIEAEDLKEAVEKAVSSEADLSEADLSEADLRRANLWGADLSEADLSGADLRRADLSEADLWGADLSEADLRRANLWGADLRRADLSGANLWGADLSGADLRRADLSGANLSGADLRRADLSGAKYNDFEIITPPIFISNLKYEIIIFDNYMKIGCQTHPHAEWAEFLDKTIIKMDGKDGLKFWREMKTVLLKMCKIQAKKSQKALKEKDSE